MEAIVANWARPLLVTSSLCFSGLCSTHPHAHPSLGPGSRIVHPMEIFLCWNLVASSTPASVPGHKRASGHSYISSLSGPWGFTWLNVWQEKSLSGCSRDSPLLSCRTSSPALLAALPFPELKADPVHRGSNPEEGEEAVLGAVPYSE